MKRLGGNCVSDKLGNKYFIRMYVYGRKQIIEFASRYDFLNNYEYYNRICPREILSYSNLDSSNVDECTPLPDDVITGSKVYDYCIERGYYDWLK